MRFFKGLLSSSAVRNKRGMTLIEIMIVLAIIGAISALLIPRFGSAQDKAKVKEAKIHIGQIIQALSFYYSDCGRYPQALTGLTQADSSCSNWGPEPYYKMKGSETSINDPWGNPYVYELQGGQFTLKSLGKDGADGGSGYAADISSEEL
ncbi:MAG: type II secretion system major pseudopilin GspG [Bdellovibrionaceae bacterium]|nr:type II secretion system major pseudopilin GspG [Pseudobdellovibrionaceae bacterium]